jgi:hypothetical protein
MFSGITEEYRSPHWCADICLGLWTKGIPGIRIEHSDCYHTDMTDLTDLADCTDITKAITFHHLKTQEDYQGHSLLSHKIDVRLV